MNNAKFKWPKYSQVAIYLHKHLEHYHQVCQMSNIWHLTHQTPIFKLHEMFQISKFFIICLFTVSLSYIHSDSLSFLSSRISSLCLPFLLSRRSRRSCWSRRSYWYCCQSRCSCLSHHSLFTLILFLSHP